LKTFSAVALCLEIHERDIESERRATWGKEAQTTADIADPRPAAQREQQTQMKGISRNIDVPLHRRYGWRIRVA
jgi:hypothetical protein